MERERGEVDLLNGDGSFEYQLIVHMTLCSMYIHTCTHTHTHTHTHIHRLTHHHHHHQYVTAAYANGSNTVQYTAIIIVNLYRGINQSNQHTLAEEPFG